MSNASTSQPMGHRTSSRARAPTRAARPLSSGRSCFDIAALRTGYGVRRRDFLLREGALGPSGSLRSALGPGRSAEVPGAARVFSGPAAPLTADCGPVRQVGSTKERPTLIAELLPAVALAVLATGPATGPTHAFLKLFTSAADAAFSGALLLRVFDPADELVAGKRRDVLPRFQCR
jgi:hypothetical protein